MLIGHVGGAAEGQASCCAGESRAQACSVSLLVHAYVFVIAAQSSLQY